MAIFTQFGEVKFGVGDQIKLYQSIGEGGKTRSQVFEGIVIRISNSGINKTITVRKTGVGQIGIEKIYPLNLPSIEKIVVVKSGTKGVRKSKLYYIRDKSKREIELIYGRAKKRK